MSARALIHCGQFFSPALVVDALQVHFADGKSTLRVPPAMSMGELLFSAAEKRKINPVEYEFFESANLKKVRAHIASPLADT